MLLAPTILVLVIGGAVSGAAFSLLVSQEQFEVREQFEHQAESYSNILRNALVNAEEELDAVAEFFLASDEVTSVEFESFAESVLRRHPELRALSWFPRIAGADRVAFEQSVREERGIDFSIRDLNADGELVPAAIRDHYFPAITSIPTDRFGVERIRGFNPFSSEARRAVFETARDTGNRSTSERVRLVSIAGGQFAVAMIQPLYRKGAEIDTVEHRRAALDGFVSAVFQVAGLVEMQLETVPPTGLDFYIYDMVPDRGPELLYYHPSRTRNGSAEAAPESTLRTGLFSTYSMDVTERTWSVIFKPAPGYFSVEIWQAWMLLFGGLLLTGTLALYQRSILMRNARVSHMVIQRTSALKRSEERYRNIIDTTNEGFSRIDQDMRVIEANDALCQMLGYERGELLGKNASDLEDKTENPGLEARIDENEHLGDTAMNREVRLTKQDGSILEARVSTSESYDDEGRSTGRFSFVTDITRQKESDAHLLQARKMEAVGRLTGGVAHEFNNLLTVVLGNIEAIESQLPKDGPLQSFAAAAIRGALRGANLTQSLLAFSRKQRLEVGETDLSGLVQGMQGLLQQTLGETIIIETDLAEGLWSISADAGQIEAALLNFVLNARDAMPGGGTICVRASNKVMAAGLLAQNDSIEPGDYVMLEVSDTGTGMTEEQIEHAFEPFYTTKEVGQGTGLGLSVAYGFAKQSGGGLEIESEPGHGTTVRLCLPRSVKEIAGARVAQETPTEAITGRGNILVLEDDTDVRALVVDQLSDLGYGIFEAEDGPAALALLDKHPEIDLLFSDVGLPGGMSGPDTAEEARRKRPDLRFLLTSGYSDKEVENLAINIKDVVILHKPYRKAELAEAISDAIRPEGA